MLLDGQLTVHAGSLDNDNHSLRGTLTRISRFGVQSIPWMENEGREGPWFGVRMNVVEVYTPAYFHILNCEIKPILWVVTNIFRPWSPYDSRKIIGICIGKCFEWVEKCSQSTIQTTGWWLETTISKNHSRYKEPRKEPYRTIGYRTIRMFIVDFFGWVDAPGSTFPVKRP